MKQKDLVKKMYEASLSKNTREMIELRRTELKHILEKRSQGKRDFSAKWIVTDF